MSVKNKKRTLWFADKKLGTCYKVKAVSYMDSVTNDLDFWVKAHNETTATVRRRGRELFTNRESAYSGLILTLNDEVEKLVNKIRRAAAEIS